MKKIDFKAFKDVEDKIKFLQESWVNIGATESLIQISALKKKISSYKDAHLWQKKCERQLNFINKKIELHLKEGSIDLLFDAAQQARTDGNLKQMRNVNLKIDLFIKHHSSFSAEDDLLIKAAKQLVTGRVSIPFPRFSQIDQMSEWEKLDLAMDLLELAHFLYDRKMESFKEKFSFLPEMSAQMIRTHAANLGVDPYTYTPALLQILVGIAKELAGYMQPYYPDFHEVQSWFEDLMPYPNGGESKIVSLLPQATSPKKPKSSRAKSRSFCSHGNQTPLF